MEYSLPITIINEINLFQYIIIIDEKNLFRLVITVIDEKNSILVGYIYHVSIIHNSYIISITFD